MKAAWIVTAGPHAAQAEALARLELVADSFLSVNTPVQYALGPWLAGRAHAAALISQRTSENLRQLDALLAPPCAVTRLRAEAGWYAVLRVPALRSDDELALLLLERYNVAVHPGHYYGFRGEGWLVVSLLAPPGVFAQGIRAVVTATSSPA